MVFFPIPIGITSPASFSGFIFGPAAINTVSLFAMIVIPSNSYLSQDLPYRLSILSTDERYETPNRFK